MKLNGTNLYLAGYDTTPGSGQLEWRMEKRSMADGGLIAGFGPTGVVVSNPTDTLIDAAYSVAIDSNHLYVAGYDSIPGDADQEWRIEKRDLGTGALITSFGTKSGAVVQNNSIGLDDRAESIAVDSSPSGTIYAAGFVRLSPTDREWRIEARDKATGLVVTSVTSSISAGNDAAHAIVIDEAEGYMYVAGSDASLGSTQWRIEKRSLSGVLALETGTFGPGYILSDYGTGADVPWAIALDANYLYIAGEVYDTTSNFTQWRIEKRSRTNGALIWEKISATGTDGVAHAIAVDGTHVYAAGFDTTAGGVIAWRIEKRDIVTGNLDSSFGSGGVVVKTLGEDVFGTPTPLDSDIWAIAVDNAYIYVAGSEGWPNVSGSRWRIEKIVK